MTKLSPHFSKVEMACRCCGNLKIEDRLLSALETLRNLAGAPVIVHDAYRCPKHNEEIGGVPDSEHEQGLAADVRISGLSLQQMYELALQVPQFANGGIGAPTMAASSMWTFATTAHAGPEFEASTLEFSTW